jgi:pyruvate ferredoxin oxidoreductase alpha subunit
MLDKDNPINIGALVLPPMFFEHKVSMIRALERSAAIVKQVGAEWGELTGRKYDTIETYMMDDAEVAIVTMSAAAGTTRAVIDSLRDEGVKAGLVRIRAYRPFPTAEVVDAIKGIKVVAVLDRASSPGAPGAPILSDVRTALFDLPKRPKVVGYVFGLGGRDLSMDMVASVIERLQKIAQTGEVGPALSYLGLRDD